MNIATHPKPAALIQRTDDVAAAREVLDRFALEMQGGPDAAIRAQANLAEAIYQLLPDVDGLREYADIMRADLEVPEGMATIGERYVGGF